MRPIIKAGTRILRPAEYDALLDQIKRLKTKYKYREIANALLYTGMRWVELERFHTHDTDPKNREKWFDRRAMVIYLPREASRKKKRTMPDRYVYLSSQGITHVENFLRYVDKLPGRVSLNNLLALWGKKANLGRISVKTFRKTWESWLVAAYPNLIPLIAMSQGHTEITAMRHYLNLPFTKEDLEEIKIRTAGWSGARSVIEWK